jgi:hypothetical protein
MTLISCANYPGYDVEPITPERHRPPAEVAKARIRLVIESVFSTLKRQMRLETHLAKTPGGLLRRIAQRLFGTDPRRLPQHPAGQGVAGARRL